MLTSAVTIFFKRVFGNKKDVFLPQNLFIMILKKNRSTKNSSPFVPLPPPPRRSGGEIYFL